VVELEGDLPAIGVLEVCNDVGNVFLGLGLATLVRDREDSSQVVRLARGWESILRRVKLRDLPVGVKKRKNVRRSKGKRKNKEEEHLPASLKPQGIQVSLKVTIGAVGLHQAEQVGILNAVLGLLLGI